eukprot:gene17047-22556_t
MSTNYNDNYGLLTSISDISTADYYSNNIVLENAQRLASNDKFLYEAALNDSIASNTDIDSYLNDVYQASNNFIRSDKLWDRERLISIFKDYITSPPGSFVCVLGGKNTGKSFLLREIERMFPDKVYIVNMRLHDTIVGGLLSTLKNKMSTNKDNVTIVKILKDILTTIWNNSNFKFKFGDVVDIDLMSLGNINIVIDEANKPFTIIDNDPVEVKACTKTLALFTQMTKEVNQLNVFLVSSEHSFPFRLKNIGFNFEDIEKNIYAGELSPAEIYKLLTNEWKVGPNLSKALELSINGNKFGGTVTAEQLSSVKRCIQLSQRDVKLKDKMVKTLTLLSVKGYVVSEGIEYFDPIEEIISQYNVGGIVRKKSFIQGLREDVWNNTEAATALIPSSQSIRLAIAK